MTTYSETNLYRKLLSIYSDRFIIVPQVHLSSLFSERVKGQNWRAAFAHINGKSVDFVFLDKNTLEIVFALELDDFTHNEEKRIIRDEEVNAIFDRARLPLVRLRNTLNKTAAQIRKEIELGLNNSI